MGTSQYSSSFGRLQSISINFLSKDFIQNLLKANDVNEMIKNVRAPPGMVKKLEALRQPTKAQNF